MSGERFIVGVLSDSHGHLDGRVAESFSGKVDHIIHAGDIGSLEVLLELESIAPVTAVLGNTDVQYPGESLGPFATPVLAGVRFAVTHDPARVRTWSFPSDTRVIVVGHTHRPLVERRDGLLWVNPGSVYRPRGPEGPTFALVTIEAGRLDASIVPLGVE